MKLKKLSLTFVALCLALTGYSQNEAAAVGFGAIEVTGQASISLPADYAEIQIGSNIRNTNAAAAHKEVTAQMAKAIEYLKKQKAVSDVKTTRVSLNTYYSGSRGENEGYSASQSLTFRLNDLSKYDEIMLGLISIGANNINNVVFKSSQTESAKNTLLQQAMQDARKKAELMAGEYGQKVGRAIMISDRVGMGNPSPMMEYKMASFDSAGPSVEGGAIEISTTVNVQFELK